MALRRHTKVLTVVSFLRVRSPDMVWYQWIYPSAGFLLTVASYTFVINDNFDYEADKLLADINFLMGILVGFYIAALAAVSSFTNDSLDQVMKGRTPEIASVRRGQVIREMLTRRRFLTILFGYCAVLSMVLYIIGVLLVRVSIAASAQGHIVNVLVVLRYITLGAYVWMIWSLLVVTLLGLHYLVERMHRA